MQHLCDAHLHLTEEGIADIYPDIGNTTSLFSCCAQYSDWEKLRNLEDIRVTKFFGIHPWYADQWNEKVEEELISLMESDPYHQVGEIGLDSGHENMDLQREVFGRQVGIASEYHRIVNVHNIGCDGDLVRILKKNGKGCKIILHSFKNPDVRNFSGLDCYFSINPRILNKSVRSVKTILSNIPENKLLLETDAPYVDKKFVSMEDFLMTIALVMDLDYDTLLKQIVLNTFDILS